jgi:hypothetical protein
LQLALTMVMDVTFIGPIFIDVSLPILLSMADPPDTVTVCPTWPESATVVLVTQCFVPEASVTE